MSIAKNVLIDFCKKSNKKLIVTQDTINDGFTCFSLKLWFSNHKIEFLDDTKHGISDDVVYEILNNSVAILESRDKSGKVIKVSTYSIGL